MKKLILLCLLSLTCNLQAAKWKSYGNDGIHNIYFDAESIKFLENKKVVQARLKVVMLKTEGKMTKDTYTVSNNKFDCQKRKFKIDEIIHYTSSNKAIGKQSNVTQWENTPPGSVYDQLSNTFCL